MDSPGPRASAVLLALAGSLMAMPAGEGAARAAASERAGVTASADALPGRFVVRGAPLARKGKTVAGRTLSVYARPAAVVLDGCRSRRARVRTRGRGASISVVARCKGIRAPVRVRAQLRGATLRGTAGRRRFTARLTPPRGRLMAGRATARALRAIRNVAAFGRHPDTEVSKARNGTKVLRTELILRLAPGARVRQVNAALRAAGGRIVGSVPGFPRLVVAIPDPGTLEVLDSLRAAIARRTGIADALRAVNLSTQELPPGFASPATGSQAAELSHLLAMRAPAAWNARRAIRMADRPTFVIVDEFGNGPFNSHIDATFDPSAFFTGQPNNHGYHVAGIAAGTFANNGTRAGRVTGVFPARTRMTVVDATGEFLDEATVLLLQAIRAEGGRMVVNSSIGHNPATDDANARKEGSDWVAAIRNANVANRLVHAGSAGNNAVDAQRNSPWVSAALRSDLADATGAALAPLTQTLAVENLADTGPPDYQPGCLSLTSNRGGNVAAVGVDVFSLKLGPTAGNDSGTSQASPQVAALAEYLWSIAPDLTAPEVAAAIRTTAAPSLGSGPPCNTDIASAPRLDAYAAVLSLDHPTLPIPGSAPVRVAILDHNGDRAFTHTDVSAFVAGLPAAAPARTWARTDLNGDGFAGGPAVAPLDLNPVGSARAGAPVFTVVSQTIEDVSVAFDEHAVTDMQALCYYAYSGLYTGSDAQRKAALDPERNCGATRPDAPESVNCTATTAFGLAATITGTSGDDEITGTAGDDVIVAGDGNDTIQGREGNDRICAGPGDDQLRGGSGLAENDDEDGFGPNPPINSGDDLMDGGPGTDRVHGTGGNDQVFGGDGDSDAVLGGSPGSDFMDGGPGDEDSCFRAEIPRDSAQPGSDSFGSGCENVFNF